MLIFDSHLDLAWNALQFERNLNNAVYTIRTQENTSAEKSRGLNIVSFPEMRRGRIALSFATLMARSTGRQSTGVDFATAAQAYGSARGHLAYYRALEQIGTVRIISDVGSLNAHVADWHQWEDNGAVGEPPPLGFLISMESADPILEPGHLQDWYDVGVRVIGITHYGPGRYAGGTSTEIGLSDIGRQLVAEMDRLGVTLDLTHCSDEAFWESLEIYQGPVLASHNNCRALVPSQRQFSDDQLRAIIERDGVIGVAMDAWMIKPDWVITARYRPENPVVTLSDVVDHIDHICHLAGNARHVAIGTDLDGGFGREQAPIDLDTIADLQKLVGLLEERGYSMDDIIGIMHGNWLRLLRRVLK